MEPWRWGALTETLNEIKHSQPSLLTSPEVIPACRLGFLCTPKPLDHGVFIAVRFATRSLGESRFHERLLVFTRRIQDAVIRVVNEHRWRVPPPKSFLQGI
jgi:hypothetical protein